MQIQIKHIKKVFKDKEVLNDISFTIESGSICGLLGVNGAGKSTLMKILYGLESQSAGEILFDGKTSIEIKDDKKFGALIESPAIYMNLSAFDNLKTKALLYDIPDETIRETLNLIGLANTGRKKAGKFSLGMKQRLGLGMAIITGLDPDGIKELLDLINSLKQKGITILISSHQLHEVSKIADDIVILHQGKIHYNQPNQDKQDLEKLFFSIVHGGYEK